MDILKIRRFRKNETGSFTIEASIVFPILLILTLCLIFFSLVIYQKAMLHYSANTIADRLAYTWDNSKKDWATGEFAANDYTTFDGGDDGLYWRFTNNNFFEQFGVNLPLGDSGVMNRKLDRAKEGDLPFGAAADISYENDLTGNHIVVKLRSPVKIPAFTRDLFGIDEIAVETSRRVNEPVEFMRNVDFVAYSMEELRKFGSFITEFRKNGRK
ncbi:TadE/TadG family type IV pilus assembly protein [Thalassobacillus hwangdonensis]|uniref:TadE/TadG family type IV pilus assembly protein n=1 Tax=Thalassobacillus hwangdonensis TaxID=546108 RepID=A0ABW3KUZ0_9BACI